MGTDARAGANKQAKDQRIPNSRLKAHRLKKSWTQVYVATMIGTTDVEVSRWETGAALPTLYFREQLCALFGTSSEELGFVFPVETEQEAHEPAGPLWSVPHRRNPFFTGREEVLTRIATLLGSKNATAVSWVGAINGPGGIGKTQVVIEYAYRHRDEYQAVFWVKADTQENLLSDIAALTILLNLPEKEEQDQGRRVKAVKRWLQAHSNWLLIMDNVEEITLVSDWLGLQTGHVLLTMQSQFTGTLASCINLERMAGEEGTLFLLHRSKLLALDATLEEVSEVLRGSASLVVELLDGLPLALDQAGAYIEETGCSLSNYLERYQHQRTALLARRGLLGADHPHSVVATITLARERLAQTNPAAVALLSLCTFLHADAVLEEILVAGASHLDPILESVAADPYLLDEAIAALRAYSLIRRDPGNKTLTIHRLVQAVLRDSMEEAEQQEWIIRVIRVVNQAFPTDMRVEQWNGEVWQHCEQLLPHALVCVTHNMHWDSAIPEAASLLLKTAVYLDRRAQYAEAEPLYQLHLRIGEQTLSPEHTDIMSSLHSRADLYRKQRKYEEAKQLYQRSLRLLEQALGPEHPLVTWPLYDLAKLYREQGSYEEAESLFQRALHIREQALGPEHPLVTWPLNGLAKLCIAQGKYTEAELLLQQALDIREKALGSEHPDLAYLLNNLGDLSDDLGKYTEAESLLQQALRLWEQALGPEHSLVALPLHNLAQLYTLQGKYEEAESLFQRARFIGEQTLGAEHPSVAYYLNGLADLYREQGKYTEAEPLYERALSIREQTLGPDHLLVARPLKGLALLYQQQGKYEEAEPLFQRALRIREQRLGLHHPDTAESLMNYGELHHMRGYLTQAEPLLLLSLRIREEALGPQHPYVASSLFALAKLYTTQGKYIQAEPLFQRALAIREQQLGSEHPDTVATSNAYANLLVNMHRE